MSNGSEEFRNNAKREQYSWFSGRPWTCDIIIELLGMIFRICTMRYGFFTSYCPSFYSQLLVAYAHIYTHILHGFSSSVSTKINKFLVKILRTPSRIFFLIIFFSIQGVLGHDDLMYMLLGEIPISMLIFSSHAFWSKMWLSLEETDLFVLFLGKIIDAFTIHLILIMVQF